MKCLAEQEATSWCNQRGVDLPDRWPNLRSGQNTELKLVVPSDRSMAGLAYSCVTVGDGGFQGGVLWMLGEWEQWEGMADVAKTTLNALRGAHLDSTISENPAVLFEASELSIANSLFLQCLFFGIDCFFVPENPEMIAEANNDGLLTLLCRDFEVAQRNAAKFHKYLTQGTLP